eukprot:CAMPEP_0201572626 /NCGR_PEP_ID=MMETSP0190_2-20130828/16011_1 /ASSEMBLY_ACC=CAM_ASM_000263 /TAXON_ID=37353 /ORGANISM="Rosalina sp." /LENGTH=706 /DNA_ID=CAMNT_0047998633 /DNA_START=473 /DNA_END=2594 /DNA_ORIENTATION=+
MSINIPTEFAEACLSYYSEDQCGDVDIPKEHFGPQLTYTYTQGNQTAYFDTASSGNGVAETDLILYVSFGSFGSCGGSTLAYASSCYNDQYNRPIAGTINFCPYMFNNNNGVETWRSDALTTLHEMTHILVMSSSLFDKFIDPLTGDTRENIIEYVNNQKYITTPKIKEYAQEFFGCKDDFILPGLPLEDDGGSGSAGSHWEEKYTQSDYMGATVYSSQTYVSEATLRLMEDSGWYYISDYTYADPFDWGKDEGCDFFNEECIDFSGDSNWPQYFCGSTKNNGCTFDHASPASCQTTSNSDGCPIRLPSSHGSYPDYEGECKDIRGNDIENDDFFSAVTYGLNSRCVDVKQSSSSYADGKCFKHSCYGWDSTNKQWEGVNIEIDSNEKIQCSRSDAYTSQSSKTFASNSITITCPDVDTICGDSSKPFECKYGNYNDDKDKQKCMCHVGYTGDKCDEEDRSISMTIASISNVKVTPIYESGMVDIEPTTDSKKYTVCLSEMSWRHSYLEGEYEYLQMHNFYPLYKSKFQSNGNYYHILWNIMDRKWIIKPVIGGSSYSTMCATDNPWNKDLETCSGNFGGAGVVTYGSCPQSARIRTETNDDNTFISEIDNDKDTEIETKQDPYYIGEYAEIIIIGALIIAFGCICAVLIVSYRKRKNNDINKELVKNKSMDNNNDENVLNEAEIEDEQVQETKITLETEMSVNLR